MGEPEALVHDGDPLLRRPRTVLDTISDRFEQQWHAQRSFHVSARGRSGSTGSATRSATSAGLHQHGHGVR